MAGVSCVLTEDQFLCPVCLEVFTDPVTTPCGHNFCQTCLKKHWDNTDHYHCPLCNENFPSRPQLKVNTIMSEMASQFKHRDENKLSSNSSESDVLCDVCAEPKLKALKSCLVCLLSYCQNHLQPHSSIQHLKKHQLIDPLKNLEDRICAQHDKPLELFCRQDWKLICLQCIYTDHKNHNAVPLKEQFEEERAEIERSINKRRELIKKVQRAVEVSEKNADAEMEKGVTFFDDLMKCVQESLSNFRNFINEKRKNKEDEAAAWIVDLKSEILYLEKRRAEMEELSKDHLRFRQTFTKPELDIRDWVKFVVPSYQGRAAKAVCELEKQLNPKIKKFFEDELNQAKEHAIDLTLDPDTAHPQLVLSKDLKEVHHNDRRTNFQDNPERFSFYLYVFGKQKFSMGKFYFEVQVKGKTVWVLGVARESVERKRKIARTPENGFWLISKGRLESCPRSSPDMVGVFVDYEDGLVCFYDADSTTLIHSYTDCCFNGNIIPLFNPCICEDGNNSAPLILTPVTD